MTVGTRIDNTIGAVTTNAAAGITVERNAGNKGYAPFPVDSTPTVVTSSTLDASNCGLTVLSGTTGVIAITMPLASTVAGATFVFRSTSADAHTLSGSQEASGIKVFDMASGSNGSLAAGVSGSKLTFPAIPGATVVLVSTGVSFMVLRVSGTMTVNGT